MSFDLSSVITMVILFILAIFSIFACAITIERFLFFSRHKIHIHTYRNYIPNNLAPLKQELAVKKKLSPFENLIFSILKTSVINRAEMKERLDAQFTEIYLIYHNKVNILGIFAKLSTLLGLFGTVTGMIESFNNIVAKGVSSASIVASGISAALITTAAGLTIAIPVTFFYEYFNDKIDGEIRKMEIITSELLSALIDKSRTWSVPK